MICNICNKDFLFLESHHIQSRCYGGSDTKSNKTNICPNCHSLVHRGKVIIEGNFRSTKDIVLVWRNEGEDNITGTKDPKVYIIK